MVYPGLRLLDLVGSLSILMSLSMGGGYRPVVVAERAEVIPSDTPLKLIPPKTFGDVPRPDALIVVGGDGAAVDALDSEALRRYVQSAARTADFVASIGTGSLILGALGLLQGRRATTHWAYADALVRMGAVYERQPWVEDGPYITAAGVSAAVDMALHLTGKLVGESRARMTQLFAEYDPEPPFGGIAWAAVETRQQAPLTPQQEALLRTVFAESSPSAFALNR
ncbi:MAG: DJ-1/PfpI family protein [Chloroflexi bacterium]|nr:DJ-1/PfpI family protein [Chloroflexota bacterium]